MPLLESSYKPPLVFRNGHLATIYSGLIRRVIGVKQTRERITLGDGDFLDLDWSYAESKTDKLIVLLHGLEGDAQRAYMLGTAKLFNKNEVDAVAVNHRSCSGEPNLKFRSYNSGASEDLHEVLQFIVNNKSYKSIYIKGFSLGGNITLKYLGEQRFDIPKEVKAAVAISVPCLLYGSCVELHKFKNVLYSLNFLKHLKNKLRAKQKRFPDKLTAKDIRSIKSLKAFDNFYTAPAHGYKDALDYYEKCSSLQFLDNIKIPTLLINAKNDSFLSKECYPIQVAQTNNNFFLETPEYGGHVAFITSNNVYYNEIRAAEFLLNK